MTRTLNEQLQTHVQTIRCRADHLSEGQDKKIWLAFIHNIRYELVNGNESEKNRPHSLYLETLLFSIAFLQFMSLNANDAFPSLQNVKALALTLIDQILATFPKKYPDNSGKKKPLVI